MRDFVGSDLGSGAMPLPLEVRTLTFTASGRRLIDGLSLSLPASGTTMVMGPNGAGKSLLLRLIHGLLAPDEGTVLWGDAPLSPEIARRQALVFQSPVLLRRSVAANIDFVLKARRVAQTGARDALLARVGLLEKARQPARRLSGGEQQRLALARALATQPDILLLDEPTASLDPASAQAIEAIVLAEAARGTKVIFVTHDAGQARRLGSDVVFLAHGRLAEHAPADRFFDAPESVAARAYLAGQLVV